MLISNRLRRRLGLLLLSGLSTLGAVLLLNQTLFSAAAAAPVQSITIDFEMSTIRVFEDVGVVNITIELSEAPTQPVSVDYRVLQAAAQEGIDYLIDPPNGTLTFEGSETKKSILVTVVDDELTEPRENFLVVLSNAVNGTLARTTGFVEITDNDGVPTLAFALQRYSFYEDSTLNRASLQLSNGSENTVFVDYETIPNSAVAGDDFVAITGTLAITPGSLTAEIPIDIISDDQFEAVESFEILLSNARNANLDPARESVEISIADGSPPELILNDFSVEENDEELQLIAFQIVLTEPSRLPINMAVATIDGTAEAGSDYASYNQSVLIPTGSEQYSLILPIFGDTESEDDETFRVMITDLSGATIEIDTATVTIIDDDAPPEIYFPIVRNE
ncbi:MAG: Calx-beta domain-containing protein [Chloroflexota bacterium]